MVSTAAATAALLSTGFISLTPNLILFLFPNYASGEGSRFLSLGQAIAAGGLLGDVFLHTLPHASHDEEAGLWVLIGFIIFFAADLLIRSADGQKEDSKKPNGATADREDVERKASMIFLNMAADALHNFTDGLAIGVTYAMQKDADLMSWQSLLASHGFMATLAILIHEVPHELGDYCSLLRGGFTKAQAIQAQFVTAIAAFVGTLVALYVAEGWAGSRLLFVTAGGFVYLAATTILPEVLHDGTSVGFRMSQLAAFCVGVGFLYIVALLEEHDHHLHHHDHQEGHHHGHQHGHHHHEHHSEL